MRVASVQAALAVLVVVAVLVGAPVSAAAAREPPSPGLQRGISLGLFAEDPGWSYRPLLDEIARTGADHVELVVAWYQHDVGSTEIYDHPRFTAPPEAIRRAIRDARAAGLRALLFPIVRVEVQRTADDWRGTLRPRDRDAWFDSYRARLAALARLAAREGAAALSIGSELSTLDGDAAPWSSIVTDVRRVFRGALTYSGNWDHYQSVAIYPLVDYAGVCGYFALAERDQAAARAISVEELTRRWLALRVDLEQFVRAVGRPLLFTELGYLSQKGSSAWPWEEGATKPVDLEEQRRCYEAFRRAWQAAPPSLLAGVYFWNWYGWGGATSGGYTPRGKPAAGEIERFFAGRR